jgi:ribosomal protein S27E
MYSKQSDDSHSTIKIMASRCSLCGNEITVEINSASAIVCNLCKNNENIIESRQQELNGLQKAAEKC